MPTTPDDLLRHLVQRVMELPPAARHAFAASKCRGDQELLQRLSAALVLAGDESFRARTDAPPPLPPPPSPAAPPHRVAPEGPGSVIGPYRLLQSLGEGGFGLVFLAEQSEPVQRQVALKIVKLGMDTAQVVARFEQERQALAVMDHPHIAKVFDAGATATGRPFFVMELCRGEPLTDYCDKNKLSIDERLALFEQVCHAVQHAHGKGIIHRDLKPSNVLVGSQDGAPHAKVIDFGIAKATQPLTDRTLFTEAQQVIGTLQYMSPEQAEGSLDIDTRTDVYALGVMLYELLTGSTPFDRRTLHEAALSEVHRLIREVEPPKPSTRIGDSKARATVAAQRRIEERRLSSLVRGELDWIAMKAIEKDRTRRYATANAIGDDVARFRRGEAVEAAPPSASYRLRKFLRRYRGPVVAAALVFVALLAGITGTAWGLFEAKQQEQLASLRADAEQRQRQRADDERDRAVRYRNRALDALRATTGEDVEKLIGSRAELTARERTYLEAIAQRWRAFATQAGEDVESRELRAEGLSQVASLRRLFDDGPHVRTAFEESLATWQVLLDAFPDRVHYESEVLTVQVNLASHLASHSEDTAAAAQLTAARERATRLVARFPDEALYRFLLARTHDGLARGLRRKGDLAAARTEMQHTSEIEQQLVAAAPDNLAYCRSLATTRGELALLLVETGEREPALREYEATRALQIALLARSPDDVDLRASAANSLVNVATIASELGQLDRSNREYRAAIEEMTRLADDFPALADNQRTLARACTKLGALLADLGQPEAAEAEFLASRARLQRLAGSDAGAPDGDLARTEYRLAMLASSSGKGDRAIELYQSARDRYQRLAAAHPAVLEHRRELADTLNQLGIALFGAQRLDEAETALAAGRDLSRRLAADHPGNDELEAGLGNVQNTLGLVYKQTGRRAEARVELEAARDARQRVAQRSPQVPRFQIMLGGSHCNVGQLLIDDDPAAALASYEAAVAVLQPLHEREPRDAIARQFLRNSLYGRGRAHSALQRWAEVAADWERCAALSEANDRGWFVQQRALALARAGAVDAAVATADEHVGDATGVGATTFRARVQALAAGSGAARRAECGDRAMALLHGAVQAGFDATKLRDDADFAALRDRDDFQQMVGGK
jgi:serine/threonine protein kinase/tetratricopeptide (TPR) repeat protein